jgi:multicomponent Na+:H+ antiporter subunit G
MMIVQIASLIFIIAGLFFCTVGIIGMVRFPDVYARIHASGKVSSLGIVGILIGTALQMPKVALGLVVLGIFLVAAAPVASQAIALAAHRQGVPRSNVSRDDLAERNIKNHPPE